jgi:hypothetical protein
VRPGGAVGPATPNIPMKPTASPDPLSADLFRFLVESVDSVPELEALLLFRDDPARSWSSADLASRLYISPRGATAIIEKLERRRWIADIDAKGRFRFCTNAPDAELIDRLSSAYAKHLSLIARVIHEKPSEGLREFAKAFRVTPEE